MEPPHPLKSPSQNLEVRVITSPVSIPPVPLFHHLTYTNIPNIQAKSLGRRLGLA
jgi:hypothetical protein